MGKLKASSSRKKKRSKGSSQARTMKKSEIRSSKYESKKLARYVSDDDDSSSSMSSSSYSSSSSSEELRHRSKRSRLRPRKDLISHKKRARRRSYSGQSSRESHRARKRKGSKRKRDYEAKNKAYPKKKPRRGDSISSSSRISWSCSTCSGGIISSHEVEFKRLCTKYGREERDERNLEKLESANKSSRYGSRKSSCSQFRESSTYQSKEKVSIQNSSRRLRSVITVAERDNEVQELNRDENKEEIIYVNDDYPSSRSDDSSDVGNKRGEGDHYLHVDLEKETSLEYGKGGDTAISDFRTEPANHGKVSDRDDGGQFDGSNPGSNEFGTTDPGNGIRTEVSGASDSMNSDDLESVLRKRALENLRRFRGGLQTSGRTAANQKDNNVGHVKQSTAKDKSFDIRSAEDCIRVVGVSSFEEDGAEAVLSTEAQLVKGVGIPVARKGATCSSAIDENITDRNPGANESLSAKQNITCSMHQMAIAGNSKENVNAGTSAVKPELATPALSKTHSPLKQAPEPEESQAKLLISESSLDESAAVTAPTVTQNSNNKGADVNYACSSAAFEPKSTLGETESDKLQDEAKEDSQFEQKTMSVMRGGEMVQVSYKVYIPKKAPALSRRQLKR